MAIKAAIYSKMQIFNEAISNIIEHESDIEMRASFLHYDELISYDNFKDIDVLIIDSYDSEFDFKEALNIIREGNSNAKTLVLIYTDDPLFKQKIISLGISGYLSYFSSLKQLIQAIKAIFNGEIWAERKILSNVLSKEIPKKKNINLVNTLTKRELEIIKLVIESKSNKEVSKVLFISENTVKSHLSKIYKKIGVNNRMQLTAKVTDKSYLSVFH